MRIIIFFLSSDVRERDVQTTVPKRRGDRVLVVRGHYLDEVGSLVERDEEAAKAYVILRSSGKEVFLSFDDICAYEK